MSQLATRSAGLFKDFFYKNSKIDIIKVKYYGRYSIPTLTQNIFAPSYLDYDILIKLKADEIPAREISIQRVFNNATSRNSFKQTGFNPVECYIDDLKV